MDKMTAKDAAKKWGVSIRQVQALLKRGRVEGAVLLGRDYIIPIDAKKPEDGRKSNGRRAKKEAHINED
jgi:predicted DNA-binding protein (UPF0251 family)